MKPVYEKISYPEGASWRFYLRELDTLPFEWHYHPEYELTLTLNSRGERYIGDHIEPYQSGDLVMLGPNLPHSWASDQRSDPDQPHQVYVLWFSQDWVNQLSTAFPEFADLHAFLDRSRRGIRWPESVSHTLQPLFQQLPEAGHRQRFTLLLSILDALQHADPVALASTRFHSLDTQGAEQRQLSALIDSIHRQYAEDLTLDTLAAQHHMSQSTLSRFFRRQMNQSVHQYLTQVRLSHACAWLIQQNTPIHLVAELSGFRNLANFNRLFKQHKGVTPRGFRQAYQRRSAEHALPSQLAGQVQRGQAWRPVP